MTGGLVRMVGKKHSVIIRKLPWLIFLIFFLSFLFRCDSTQVL